MRGADEEGTREQGRGSISQVRACTSVEMPPMKKAPCTPPFGALSHTAQSPSGTSIVTEKSELRSVKAWYSSNLHRGNSICKSMEK